MRALAAVGVLVLCGLGAGSASAASAIDVSIAPAVASISNVATFTMSSDDPAVRRAAAVARPDDGSPCPASIAFLPVSWVGLGGTVPYAAGTTSVPFRLTTPALYRVCAYLYGNDPANTLALADHVVAVRAPTASITAVAASPASPRFGDRVSVRVTGSAEIDGSIALLHLPGACPVAEIPADLSPDSELVPAAGPFDVTVHLSSVATAGSHLCAWFVSGATFAPIAVSDTPFTVDAGGTLKVLSTTISFLRVTVTAAVSGVRGAWVIVDGEPCAPEDGPTQHVAHHVAVATCFLPARQGRTSFQIAVAGRTLLGAEIESPASVVDVAAAAPARFAVVEGLSIGGIRLGQSRALVARINGEPLALVEFTKATFFLNAAVLGESGTVTFASGRVTAIRGRGPLFRTSRGVHAGMSAASARRADPRARCISLLVPADSFGHLQRTRRCYIGRLAWLGSRGRRRGATTFIDSLSHAIEVVARRGPIA